MEGYAKSKHGIGFTLMTHITGQVNVVCAGVWQLDDNHWQDDEQEHIAKYPILPRGK